MPVVQSTARKRKKKRRGENWIDRIKQNNFIEKKKEEGGKTQYYTALKCFLDKIIYQKIASLFLLLIKQEYCMLPWLLKKKGFFKFWSYIIIKVNECY